MHLVNGTGNSPSPGQPTLEYSNRISHPGAPLHNQNTFGPTEGQNEQW